MKKTITMLCASSLLFGLTACGGGSSDSSAGVDIDPMQLTYTGKTEYVDLVNMTDKQRKDLATKYVEFYNAFLMYEHTPSFYSMNIYILRGLIEENYGLVPGTQVNVDYTKKSSSDFTYCGGTGALTVSDDFVLDEDEEAPFSLLTVQASAGSLQWKLDNYCVQREDNKITVSASANESYGSNSVISSFNTDAEYVDNEFSIKCSISMEYSRIDSVDPESDVYAYKCREGNVKIDNITGGLVAQTKSGEKVSRNLSGNNDVRLSSYGTFYVSSNEANGCYDRAAKLNRIQSGRFVIAQYSYNAENTKYYLDNAKSYVIDVEQKDPAKCGQPLITVSEYTPVK